MKFAATDLLSNLIRTLLRYPIEARVKFVDESYSPLVADIRFNPKDGDRGTVYVKVMKVVP